MAHLLAQVRLQRVTGLPEDAVVNTFHFDQADASLSAALTVAQAVEDFYTEVPAVGLTPVMGYLSVSLLAASGHEIRVYDMAAPEPRVPVVQYAMSLPGLAGGGAYPAEISCCLSFRGALISGQNPARRRGRVYLGPLITAAGLAVSSGDIRPVQAFINTIVESGLDLINHATANWCVFSEANQELVPVAVVWADNAYDIQRRRGAAATTRTLRPVP